MVAFADRAQTMLARFQPQRRTCALINARGPCVNTTTMVGADTHARVLEQARDRVPSFGARDLDHQLYPSWNVKVVHPGGSGRVQCLASVLVSQGVAAMAYRSTYDDYYVPKDLDEKRAATT